MKRLLLFVLLVCVATACDKDEKGNLLAKNYLTATINGVEYMDRQLFNLWNPTTPKATYSAYHVATDLSDILVIESELTPKREGEGATYRLMLYIPSFDFGRSWQGFETTFELAEAVEATQELAPLKSSLEAGKAVAILQSSATDRRTLSGTLHIKEQQGEWFRANIALQETDFQLQGELYTFIKGY